MVFGMNVKTSRLQISSAEFPSKKNLRASFVQINHFLGDIFVYRNYLFRVKIVKYEKGRRIGSMIRGCSRKNALKSDILGVKIFIFTLDIVNLKTWQATNVTKYLYIQLNIAKILCFLVQICNLKQIIKNCRPNI